MPVPRCLEGLTVESVEPTWHKVSNLVFRISCVSCDASAFALELTLTGGSERGLSLICEKCGHATLVFDGLKHGYDGELGNAYLTGETTRERLLRSDGSPVRSDRIFLQFLYNIEVAELDEITAQTKVAQVDLFDAFIVSGDNSSGEALWYYECA
jgi:hypothetical protein